MRYSERMLSAAEHLSALVSGPDGEVSLAEAALVFARHEYPQLNVDAYLRELDALASRLRGRLPADAAKAHIIAMLNHFMFSDLGYSANRANYYDPRNSFLNEVMDRRTGIPITVSIVYVEIARRVGLALAGVSFPGHFLVKCVTEQGVIVLDPYNGGVSLSEEELRERLTQMSGSQLASRAPLGVLLKAATKREILVRLARNLKGVYSEAGELEKALAVINLILAVMPDAAQEFRDRGMIFNKLECFRAALADLERFVELDAEASEDDAMQSLISELRHKNRLLN
jgi:regulator of sirC expression with transglutaminase-like and TPR domain